MFPRGDPCDEREERESPFPATPPSPPSPPSPGWPSHHSGPRGSASCPPGRLHSSSARRHISSCLHSSSARRHSARASFADITKAARFRSASASRRASRSSSVASFNLSSSGRPVFPFLRSSPPSCPSLPTAFFPTLAAPPPPPSCSGFIEGVLLTWAIHKSGEERKVRLNTTGLLPHSSSCSSIAVSSSHTVLQYSHRHTCGGEATGDRARGRGEPSSERTLSRMLPWCDSSSTKLLSSSSMKLLSVGLPGPPCFAAFNADCIAAWLSICVGVRARDTSVPIGP